MTSITWLRQASMRFSRIDASASIASIRVLSPKRLLHSSACTVKRARFVICIVRTTHVHSSICFCASLYAPLLRPAAALTPHASLAPPPVVVRGLRVARSKGNGVCLRFFHTFSESLRLVIGWRRLLLPAGKGLLGTTGD